jgi:hypothetical protein
LLLPDIFNIFAGYPPSYIICKRCRGTLTMVETGIVFVEMVLFICCVWMFSLILCLFSVFVVCVFDVFTSNGAIWGWSGAWVGHRGGGGGGGGWNSLAILTQLGLLPPLNRMYFRNPIQIMCTNRLNERILQFIGLPLHQ